MASFSNDAMLSILTGGAVTAIVDVIGRLKNGEASPAIVHPDAGGHILVHPDLDHRGAGGGVRGSGAVRGALECGSSRYRGGLGSPSQAGGRARAGADAPSYLD